uniref:Uncharacterized protein n=1 Tax=Anabas testudineus TaxID=64144 RepID=A0A3Q1JQ70_ANATE
MAALPQQNDLLGFLFFICYKRLPSFSLYQVTQVMNSGVGRYLSSHPFLALTVMLFSSMAAVPVGLFLIFALVTIVMSAIGFVFCEGMCVLMSESASAM